MNFFKSGPKQKSPSDTVKAIKDNIARLDTAGSNEAKKKTSEYLANTKVFLVGDGDEPSPDVVTQVANEVYKDDLLNSLVVNMHKFEFEARKDICTIYSALLRRQIGSRAPTVDYIRGKPEIIFNTLKGYDNPDIALNTGTILKEMLRHEELARILLYSDQFYTFPHYIEGTTFGISTDAFSNMKDTLTKHKPMVAAYLESKSERNYERFFNMYTGLINSSNYVTKRQSLKLLGEILLDRANYHIMTRYISSEENLKLMMNFLRDKSRNIQFEAFHVFKVFVANPNKPPQIASILRRNKEKLLAFLKDFHNDKDDEQFNDEKQFLIAQISQM